MVERDVTLMMLLQAIVAGDVAMTASLLAVSHELAGARAKQGATRQAAAEHYLAEIEHYLYAGDSALHIAAAAYRPEIAGMLLARGADVGARNRRGAEPLHYAADGSPGSPTWNPRAQAETVTCLIAAGANPNARDNSGVTPLHRAVRCRCAAAVKALLDGGADPRRPNSSGSTPMQLATWTSGRSGAGSAEAKGQQEEILHLLQGHGVNSRGGPPASATRPAAGRKVRLPSSRERRRKMCFSPQADLIGGVVLGVIGIDTVRQCRHKRELALASLPLLLAAHQFVESFVWFGLQGEVPAEVGRIAMWGYLFFAFCVLPIYVPGAIMGIERTKQRVFVMVLFLALGVGVAVVLLQALVRGPTSAALGAYHIEYSIPLRYGYVVVGLYISSTCGAMIFSGYRHVAQFGAVNLVVAVILAWLATSGFASLWCAWAAVASGAISLHLRHVREQHRIGTSLA